MGVYIMLVQFNFKNYRSFRDETTLDLSATRITEHSAHIISINKEHILPAAAIYGANASGKSNIIKAVRFMHAYVILSFGFDDDETSTNNKQVLSLAPVTFKFDASTNEGESLFEVFFTLNSSNDNRVYQYGFSLEHNFVKSEWLRYKATNGRNWDVFSRTGQKIEFVGNVISKIYQTNILASLSPKTLVLSLGAKLRSTKLLEIFRWFTQNEVVDYGDADEISYRSNQAPDNFIAPKKQDSVLKYLSTFDSSIRGFSVTEDKESTEEKHMYRIDALHNMIDTPEQVSLPLNQESSGTLKMFELFDPIRATLNRGGVLFIDELNSRLHPLLVRNIILTYLNEETNPHHAQIVFTTHDVWQLSSNALRRDEIWITEKNANGISSLTSLSDYIDEDGDKIRKDENYEKNYLLGKYGGIPPIKALSFDKEDD